MSYTVLARKWRPRQFADLVGQQHVLQALVNALDTQRLHHAYLFTGTRGVGKTTVARIIAKSLNCEVGISSQPCGQCGTCQAIDNGNCVDLIEIDAASKTKVEDTRDILNNVAYAPTQCRFKIYLIDEVHMLSNSSFNALLKTLEEPPEHVKFLLATTDPQKIPATVLSRCLQFNLKNLLPEQIMQYLQSVLTAEQISAEDEALWQIAHAARGSMRDALSITDQAIAFCAGSLTAVALHDLLGTVAQQQLEVLLPALLRKDTTAVLACVKDIAAQGSNLENALASILKILHLLALAHAVPEIVAEYPEQQPLLEQLLPLCSAEDVQLLYQIGLNGRRDMALAPSLQMGLEMTLLRMMVFQPQASNAMAPTPPRPAATTTTATTPAAATPVAATPVATTPPSTTTTPPTPAPNITSATDLTQAEAWHQLVDSLQLRGVSQALANNASVAKQEAQLLTLYLAPEHSSLVTDSAKDRLTQALQKKLGAELKLDIITQAAPQVTPAKRTQAAQDAAKQQAEAAIAADPTVNSLIEQFDAIIAPDSIEPI